MKNFIENIANNLVEVNRSTKEDFLTGEMCLCMTGEQLREKILKFKNGKSYLGVLNIEYRALEHQGVIKGRMLKSGKVLFDIKNWDSFISRVNAFHEICGPY